MNNRTNSIAQGALIAALYIVLTLVSNIMGLASGVIQIRLSEAMTILPIFTPAAVPGLCVGCFISNIITGCAPMDVICGTVATLIGALLTKSFANHPVLASLPPIIANTLIIPWVLALVYNFEGSVVYFTATVFIGELIAAGLLGQVLRRSLEPYTEQLGWRKKY